MSELLLADAITANDYKEFKAEAEFSIIKLEAKINDPGEKSSLIISSKSVVTCIVST